MGFVSNVSFVLSWFNTSRFTLVLGSHLTLATIRQKFTSKSIETYFQQLQDYQHIFLSLLIISLSFRVCVNSSKKENNLKILKISLSHLLMSPSPCHICEILQYTKYPYAYLPISVRTLKSHFMFCSLVYSCGNTYILKIYFYWCQIRRERKR